MPSEQAFKVGDRVKAKVYGGDFDGVVASPVFEWRGRKLVSVEPDKRHMAPMQCVEVEQIEPAPPAPVWPEKVELYLYAKEHGGPLVTCNPLAVTNCTARRTLRIPPPGCIDLAELLAARYRFNPCPDGQWEWWKSCHGYNPPVPTFTAAWLAASDALRKERGE